MKKYIKTKTEDATEYDDVEYDMIKAVYVYHGGRYNGRVTVKYRSGEKRDYTQDTMPAAVKAFIRSADVGEIFYTDHLGYGSYYERLTLWKDNPGWGNFNDNI